MMSRGAEQFRTIIGDGESAPIELYELSLQNVRAEERFDVKDYCTRVDIMNELGKTVMVSNTPEFYRLAAHIRRSTSEPIAIVLSTALLRDLFNKRYYEDLPGGMLEAFGRLMKLGINLLVYPVLTGSKVITLENLELECNDLHLLLCYLKADKHLQELACPAPQAQFIDVSELLAQGDPRWEQYVCPEVAHLIRSKRAFQEKTPSS
jgi:hypothetical protein